MALQLIDESPVFARRMEECAAAIDPLVEWELLEALEAADERLWESLPFVNLALFATAVSLVEVWRAFGVRPAAVLGQSIGDNAAACVAGALSLEDAARLTAGRARALETLSERGAMAWVAMAAEEVEARLEALPGFAEVAGIVSPRSTTVAGDADSLDALLSQLAAEGVRGRLIEAGMQAHTSRLEEIRDTLEAEQGEVGSRSFELPFYSSLTGGRY
jgi:acyl transferase domain-containing protein